MSASESNPILLYDIKSAPPLATWSPAVWKARCVYIDSYLRISKHQKLNGVPFMLCFQPRLEL